MKNIFANVLTAGLGFFIASFGLYYESFLTLTLGAAVFVATAANYEAYSDSDWVTRIKKPINHIRSSVIRIPIIGLFPVVYFFNFYDLDRSISLTGILLGVFWILFDLSYNHYQGLKYSYIGRTSFLDRMARRLDTNMELAWSKYLVIKLTITGLFILLSVVEKNVFSNLLNAIRSWFI